MFIINRESIRATIRKLENPSTREEALNDIKKMLDAQYDRTSDLQAIINFIEVLKLAGLVEM